MHSISIHKQQEISRKYKRHWLARPYKASLVSLSCLARCNSRTCNRKQSSIITKESHAEENMHMLGHSLMGEGGRSRGQALNMYKGYLSKSVNQLITEVFV